MKHKGRSITPHLIMDGVKADTLGFGQCSITGFLIGYLVSRYMFWTSRFVYWLLLGTRRCVQTCITSYISQFEFSYFRPHEVTRQVRAFFQAVLLPPGPPCFWRGFFVIFGVPGICTFVAKNRPDFSRSWVEESNALTRNPWFRR